MLLLLCVTICNTEENSVTDCIYVILHHLLLYHHHFISMSAAKELKARILRGVLRA